MKFYYYLGIIGIMLFSFYYTDQIANYVLKSNDMYQKIDSIKDKYEEVAVNAYIDGDNIIPGLNGLEVDVKKSYYKMKKTSVFNEYYLVYNQVLPNVSISNNMDKIIKRGNSKKRIVAFIIDSNKEAIEYFINNSIDASILVDLNSFDNSCNLEQINNDIDSYSKLDILLNKYHKNTNICYYNDDIKDICLNNNKYMIKSDYVLDNQSFLQVRNNISSGDIYYITRYLSLDNLVLLIKDINYKDLSIVTLSSLISEDRS